MTIAYIKFKGLAEYERKLSKLQTGSQEIAAKAIFEGAKIVADAVKENLENITVATNQQSIAAYKKGEPTYINKIAKKGLVESFGISPMRLDDDGFFNVKLGFDGYNSIKTKKYPKGQPNQMIARACESGSSAIIKQPFMRTAVNSSRKAAESKMAEIIDEEIEKQMEE